jgi:hypothetical protein
MKISAENGGVMGQSAKVSAAEESAYRGGSGINRENRNNGAA